MTERTKHPPEVKTLRRELIAMQWPSSFMIRREHLAESWELWNAGEQWQSRQRNAMMWMKLGALKLVPQEQLECQVGEP